MLHSEKAEIGKKLLSGTAQGYTEGSPYKTLLANLHAACLVLGHPQRMKESLKETPLGSDNSIWRLLPSRPGAKAVD
jgi:hypothetical protein